MSRYLRFLGLAALVAGATALAGWWPTRYLGGGAAVTAMLAGCAVSWLASAIGGIPIAIGAGSHGANTLSPALLSMAVRLFAAVVLGALAVLVGGLERTALLIWIAISYMTLLTADTHYALGSLRTSST